MENITQGFHALSVPKQLGILIALAASVALGVYVVLWSQTPNYTPVLPDFEGINKTDIIEVLQQNHIPFQVEFQSGIVLVENNKLYEARMRLAQEGVSSLAGSSGFEILDKESSFGNSQFIEQTKYIRGLQGELSKTISSIKNIRKARVHLAIPKNTSFVRDQKKVSASVFLELQAGKTLERGQSNAIVNLMATSVPGMSPENVTIIDQNGNLLSLPGEDLITLASRQMDYVRHVEDSYSRRIEQLLTPMLGSGRIRAEVTATFDFTEKEETAENFDPKASVVRNEKTSEEARVEGSASVAGIPGAVSNQPPVTGTVSAKGAGGDVAAPGTNKDQRTQASRQYEVDRSIKHIKNSVGVLQKLSVAVLVDDKVAYEDDGSMKKTPLNEEELKRIKNLVQNAVGWDEKRGDSVTILNASFAKEAPLSPEAPVPFYQQDWFPSVAKQGAAALVVLLLLFMVLKPTMKNLTTRGKEELEQVKMLAVASTQAAAQSSPTEEGPKKIVLDKNKSEKEVINTMIDQDPKRVAQVVMEWVGKED